MNARIKTDPDFGEAPAMPDLPSPGYTVANGADFLAMCRARHDIEAVSVGATPGQWRVTFRPAPAKTLKQAELFAA